jgi:tetratricopeptide (TPR) repeat protein
MASRRECPRRRCGWLLVVAFSLTLSFLSHDAVAFTVMSNRQRTSDSLSPAATTAADETATSSQSTERILESVRAEHEMEFCNGFSVFGKSDERHGREWSDDDFVGRRVGVGNAGPDEFILKRGDEIFETIQPVLSRNECNDLISEARDIIAKGLEAEKTLLLQDGERTPTNSELGEARVSQMPRAKEWLRAALHERFFPILESRFGVPVNELTLHDALIIGYGYFGAGSRSQPIHRDSSLLSLNVALSSQTSFDPDGGGTFFEGLPANESVIKTEQGHVLCHAGGAQHAGRGINGGERWVLVLFCIAKNAPQLARRCHAKGIIERGRNDLQAAEAVFRAGLTLAPKDHLLLSSLGGVAMAKGLEAEAQNSLSAAALSYMHCQKANLGLGRMMLSSGKPRAALRRFESVLEWMDNRDRMQGAWMPLRAMGWDARVYGAHSAIICVQEAKKVGATFSPSTYLPRAIDWLNVAREAAPEDPRVLGALAKAEELLSEDSDSTR